MLVDFHKICPRIHSKGVNIECLHVRLVQSLDITSIKMSYSSAARLEVSSASVKHLMKRCTQEWPYGLRVVPAMRLLLCTCSSWHWAQHHALCETGHEPMPCLQVPCFQSASCGTSFWEQMIKPCLNPTGTDLDMDFYTVSVPCLLGFGSVFGSKKYGLE